MALLCALMVLGCVGVALADHEGEYVYEVLEDGNAKITAYNGSEKTEEIPSEINGHPVIAIGEKAFSAAEYTLERVIIPDSVVTLEDCAFDKCSRITEMVIPDSVTNVIGNPFRQCFRVKFTLSADHPALAVSEGVLFSKADRRLVCYPGWKDLKEYTIPQGIKIIGKNAFYRNDDLEKVFIPDSVKEIQASAFDGCHQLRSAAFQEGLTTIGENAFWYCRMVKLEIPGSVTYVGKNAFSSMGMLTLVKFAPGEEPLEIDDYAFQSSKLNKIEIHREVKLGKGAFYSCKVLGTVLLDGRVSKIGSEAFSFCTALKKIEIPGDLTTLPEMVFFQCTALQEVVLPDTIEKLEYGVLSGCEKLKTINLPRSITAIEDLNLVEDCPQVTVTVARSSLGETHCQQNKVKYVYEEVDSAPELSWLNPTEVPAPTACPACGYEFPEGQTFKFCPECGHQL